MDLSMAGIEEDEERKYSPESRWKSLFLLAKSDNNKPLTDCERNELNELLQYVNNNNINIGGSETVNSDDKEQKKYNINWCRLLNVIFLICISSFIFGYITIQTAAIVDKPQGHKGLIYHRFRDMSSSEKKILKSSAIFGAAIASFLIFVYSSCNTTITYTFNRRYILLLSNFPIILGGIVAITAEWISSWCLVIGYTIQGMGVGISSIVAPILIAELSPTPYRAFLTWFSQLFITFGMFANSMICWGTLNVYGGWIYVTLIGIIPSFIQIFFKGYINQSPRLLIAKFYKQQKHYSSITAVNEVPSDINECHEAKEIINLFYGDMNDAQQEYEKIARHLINNDKTCVKHDGSGLFSISRLIINDDENMDHLDFRRSLFVGIFMNLFQQFTGCNVILYNGQKIIKSNLFSDNGTNSTILYGTLFISTIVCVFCVKYNFIKHRTLLFVGTFMMLTAVLLLGITNVVCAHDSQDIINKLALSKLPFYIFGFAMSLSGFTWLVNTELFPLCRRIQFGSFVVFIQWFSNALISLSVSNGWIQVGSTTLYFICGAIILLCIAFITKYIPETKGISLEYAVRAHNHAIIWIS